MTTRVLAAFFAAAFFVAPIKGATITPQLGGGIGQFDGGVARTSASPPPTHIQGNFTDGSGTTCAVTLPAAVKIGDTVVGAVDYSAGTVSISSILDDKSNAYTPVINTAPDGATATQSAFFLSNIVNGPKTITVTFATSTSYCGMWIDEYANVAGLDTTVPSGGGAAQFLASASGANALTSGNATTFTNGDLIWGAVCGSTAGPTIGIGFTLRNNDSSFGCLTEDMAQSAASAAAATATVSSGGGFVNMLAMKPQYAQSPATFFSFDGFSSPVIASPVGVKSSTTGKLWLTWEGTSGTSRVQEVRTIDGAANMSAIATAGTTTLSGDLHGDGTIAYHEASGHAYIFYGSHDTSQQIATSTNSNDPSAWTASSLASTTYGPFTFPRAIIVGNTLYLFYCTSGTGSSNQESIAVTTASINASTGVLTWSGTRQVLFDAPNAWLLGTWGAFLSINGKVVLSWNYGTTFGTPPVQNIYFAYYDPSNGNVSNFAGTTVVASGSQPVGLSSMNSNFLIYTSTNITQPLPMIDTNGVMHVIALDLTLSPIAIIDAYNRGSGWNTATVAQTNVGNYGVVQNGRGGVDVYYSDGTFPGTSGFGAGGGNLKRASVSSNGVVSGATTILAATSNPFFPIGAVDPMASPPPNARVVFGEESLDGITQSGFLRSYVYGDSGYLH
jgi:hypothetical protein